MTAYKKHALSQHVQRERTRFESELLQTIRAKKEARKRLLEAVRRRRAESYKRLGKTEHQVEPYI